MNMQQPQPNASAPRPPIATPVASNGTTTSPLADDQSGPIPSANSGAPRGTTTPANTSIRQRISATGIDVIADQLSDRDHAILRSVDAHQFLTVHHIEALHFDPIAPAARSRITRLVLARLRELRVLGALDRRIGGTRAGSQGLIYHVGVAGDRLLARAVRRSARLRYEPSARFLNHRLAIADAHIALIQADQAQTIELVASAVEPVTWRTFTGLGASRRTLKPDLFAETATTDDLVHAWFIEIDLGTESIPTLLKKCREYEAYRQSGIEQDRHGAFPLVVWSITHPDPAKAARRRQALAEAIAADPRLPTQLFSIVAPDALLTVIQKGGAQ
ncbi:replication-relaxation family protein [Mycolicibacterium alvei]|uniref:Replication-relaxation n=1 Tax=Mycolicibacterium alvei TaxID=67081 RepID=A0A6N4UNM4_9MYCO|nr:replication-relaxation family protein [Mycolicibacterium alvei]MCV6999581.1 replication-relaxation family protein [Mycolicibacterium alvei]BBX25012.1 hypothetical protein MALV_01370 [Mycolicibacterium alvei]